MRGHEYVRDAVCEFLADQVPARLTAHLDAIEQTEPDPASVVFVLADSLQDLPDVFPVVAVRSTDSTDETRVGASDWTVVYDIEVMVATSHQTYGAEGFEQASRARDRLLLACREALWRVRGMSSSAADGDIEFLPGKRPERTGRGNQQTLSGLALAVGTLGLRVRVTETLTDLDPPETVGAVDLSVTGADASQAI